MLHQEDAGRPAQPPTIDDLAVVLRRLRQEADNPSYAELAVRISRSREAAGRPAAQARIARSTVYDVFRDGRRRIDIGLVREVLAALGLDAEAVAHWTAVARRAVPGPSAGPDGAGPEGHEVDPHGRRGEGADDLDRVERPEDAAEAVHARPDEADGPTRPRPARRLVLVLLGCVVGNLVGRALADALGLPLHLDMVWTAFSAILLGPWWGALVAVTTNGLGASISGVASLPFALVNVTGALVWGYGVRRFGLGRTVPRFFALSVACAVACSVVATPILLLFFDGTLGFQTDRVSEQLTGMTHLVVLAIFLPNLILSVADKTVSGFVALAVLEARGPARTQLSIGDVVVARRKSSPATAARMSERATLRTGCTD